MDYQQQPHMNLTLHPAHLWIGDNTTLITLVEQSLQQTFCKHNACKRCITCMNIIERQHHNIRWLHPEKNYILEDLEPIFTTTSFNLAQDEHFFFVIQKADFLSTACSNSLLKIIEEPPIGYHFIVLAERHEAIIPTIRSRCLIKKWHHLESAQSIDPLLSCFMTLQFPQPSKFLELVEKSNLNERDTIDALDSLFAHWLDKYNSALSKKNNQIKQAESMVLLLKTALTKPPMPGSAKIFWKNIVLQVNHQIIKVIR